MIHAEVASMPPHDHSYPPLMPTAAVLPWLDATMLRLTDDRYCGRTEGGGFNEHAKLSWDLLPDAPRTQNTHMHLLEAFLVAFEATGEVRYRQEAAGIVELFFAKLFDRQHACIGEFFDRAWAPDAAHGAEVEPGHSFEWVFLLHEYYKLQVR